MSRLQQETFEIFISHKLSDRKLAELVAHELDALGGGAIKCWVSGQDLNAGVDWNRQIKDNLAESHLLVLLFTTPALNWDWCLYEVGLFVRFDADDVQSVVCLFDPDGSTPGPLSQVQGVGADVEPMVRLFLEPLCTKTWCMSDDWQRGALVPDVERDLLVAVAERIVAEFTAAIERSSAERRTNTYHYRPCHRIVLDLPADGDHASWSGIPLDSHVVAGVDDTTSYTLSLFRIHECPEAHTWHELVAEVDGVDAEWRIDLDHNFVNCLAQRLWAPSTAVIEAWEPASDRHRAYLPVLYDVERRNKDHRPVRATILLSPVAH
jgi:TIR domain